MPGDYATLAPVYDQIGLSEFAMRMTPRLIDYAQRHEWVGRRVLELGCGTGMSLRWLAERSYLVTGVDNSPQMLELARARLDEARNRLNYTLTERDIREPAGDLSAIDLVLALDVMNELNSLRDLEIVFKDVQQALNNGRLFIFDMFTIQGLAARALAKDQIVHDSLSLSVIARNQFDYDRQLHESHYIVFFRKDDCWQRSEASRILRAFPVQAVAMLLQRCGFQRTTILNLDFGIFDPALSSADRVIFMAEKGY